MNNVIFASVIVTAALAAPAVKADADHADHPAKPASKEFARMKQLVGTWTGAGDVGGKKEDTVVTYRLTSGGNAIVETLGPGTPHEMVSVWHDEGGKLAMTHYCAMGNRPHMKLTKSDDKALSLEVAKGGEVDTKKEVHMHAVTLTFVDNDHLNADWTSWASGKDTSHVLLTLSRTPEATPATK